MGEELPDGDVGNSYSAEFKLEQYTVSVQISLTDMTVDKMTIAWAPHRPPKWSLSKPARAECREKLDAIVDAAGAAFELGDVVIIESRSSGEKEGC